MRHHRNHDDSNTAVPGPVVGLDGTRVTFWALRRGVRYRTRSRGWGATIERPNGDRFATWGLSLRQWLNVIPGAPRLGKLRVQDEAPRALEGE